MMRILLTFALLLSPPAFAIFGLGGLAGPKDLKLESIRTFYQGHRRIIQKGACEKLLLEASDRIGRPLTHEEIDGTIEQIVQATGELLTAWNRIPCFSPYMNVLTPTGEKQLMDIQLGETVISLNLEAKDVEPVANAVREKFQLNVDPHLDDYYETQSLPRPLIALEGARAWTLKKKGWFSSVDLSRGQATKLFEKHDRPRGFVLYNTPEDWLAKKSPTLYPVPQQKQKTMQIAICIDLNNPPYNMIVNGILVPSVGGKY